MDNSAAYYSISRLYDSFVTNANTKGRFFFMFDIGRDIARWSPEAVAELGLPGEIVHGQVNELKSRLAPEDAEVLTADLDIISKGRMEKKETQWRIRNKEGNTLLCSVKYFAVKDYSGRASHLAAVITNRGVESQLDPTTGLPDQPRFLDHLRKALDVGRSMMVMLIGIEGLDEINTTYGYTFGNKVIAELAARMQEFSRGIGDCFRGEGKYLLFCSDSMTENDMRGLYNSVRNYARHQLTVDKTRVRVRLSAGIVEADDPKVDVHAILASAFYAQSKSSSESDGEIVVLQNDYLNDHGKTLILVNKLHGDVEEGCRNFSLVYQPILQAADDKLLGGAAYLRWNSGSEGEVSPSEILRWMERDVSFSKLGNWILERGINEGKTLLEDHPGLLLNINLAQGQLEQPEFHQVLLSALKNASFPGGNLCLELTDRCRLLNPGFLAREINFIKACGIKVALDGSCLLDFRLVRELPVDIIKIGRQFTAGLMNSDKDRALLKAICGFAADCGILVCAEGVENREMLIKVRNYGVQAYQGYVASAAVPIDDFTKLPQYTR
ncbi:MAG: EAL domain-containing protein [Lachnospiraceae bacterium]|nr:EAL domain-containing protein [Lachnospiraceae bacterium]